MARLSLENIPVSALLLPDGTALLDPPRRRVSSSFEVGESPVFNPPPGSAAYAWRKLGLVDDSGAPTPRGRLFSRFQGGEGLMVAAALEDATYPIEDIVARLANLRGGPRFLDFADGPSHRLAADPLFPRWNELQAAARQVLDKPGL